jgi:hypothetical protein
MKRKQRGGSMFGMLGTINQTDKYFKPLQDFAPRLLATGLQMASDIKGGKDWKESALNRIPETLKQVVAGKPLQLGNGIRRRRISKKKKKNGIHSRRLV